MITADESRLGTGNVEGITPQESGAINTRWDRSTIRCTEVQREARYAGNCLPCDQLPFGASALVETCLLELIIHDSHSNVVARLKSISLHDKDSGGAGAFAPYCYLRWGWRHRCRRRLFYGSPISVSSLIRLLELHDPATVKEEPSPTPMPPTPPQITVRSEGSGAAA